MLTRLEFHDSRLDSIDQVDGGISLRLLGYVHEWSRTDSGWKGRGLSQPIAIEIAQGAIASHQSASLPLEIGAGTIHVGLLVLKNSVPLPLAVKGETAVWIQFQSGERILIHGTGVQVAAEGVAAFVEDLPLEMLPRDAK